MAQLSTNLIVRGESVQALYSQFRAGNLVVNRRYQRKLVWSVEEKQSFVDSLQKQLPVPLILVAERPSDTGTRLEVIDGLQRLDAIFGFINNAFRIDEGFFDLATLAESKDALDSGNLKQEAPKILRETCIRFVGYSLPLSVYRAATDDEVDEVFRRINSGGRHLSRQGLRQAGRTSRPWISVRCSRSAMKSWYSSGERNTADRRLPRENTWYVNPGYSTLTLLPMRPPAPGPTVSRKALYHPALTRGDEQQRQTAGNYLRLQGNSCHRLPRPRSVAVTLAFE